MEPRPVRIGTSGWSYPSGEGTWNGVFYPKPRPRGFDELAFYAEHFDFVELNTTFYGQPRPEVAAKWAERTPPGFEFSAKLYQQFTHPRLFRARVESSLLKTLRIDTADEIPPSVIDALVRTNQADIDEFRRGLEPLAAAGKLGALVAQFPASFRNDLAARAHLAALLRAFHGFHVCVELRHATWSTEAALAMLHAFDATWLEIDEPRFKDSVRAPAGASEQRFRYLRLHGRNAAAWWKSDRDSRYAYDYSADELKPIAQSVARSVRPQRDGTPGRAARVAFNNHPNARAVGNAQTLREMVDDLVAQAAARVPEHAPAVSPGRSGDLARSPGKE
jgi:uncharacterized protein YecE (DUF72 family)